jgi:hypothetical protein
MESKDGNFQPSEVTDWEEASKSTHLIIQLECQDTTADVSEMCSFTTQLSLL